MAPIALTDAQLDQVMTQAHQGAARDAAGRQLRGAVGASGGRQGCERVWRGC